MLSLFHVLKSLKKKRGQVRALPMKNENQDKKIKIKIGETRYTPAKY